MGHRANLVLIDGAEYQLFYCHWCATQIPKDIFWGVHFAIPYILQQQIANRETGWLDNIWSEGGVLVDTVKHVLLLYGGEDIQYDPRLRRVYLELLQETWSGWDVRWAYEGVFDMADYVGLPRSQVTARYEIDDRVTDLNPPEKWKYTDVIGSVILEDGKLRLYALRGDTEWYLNRGTALVEMARQNPGLNTLPLNEWMNEFPHGGFHIDAPQKQLAFWASYDESLFEHIRPIWPDWEILWLKDQFEYQMSLAKGRLIFPSRSPDDLLADLEKILMAGNHDALKFLLQMVKEKEDLGHDVQVNPNALQEAPQNVPITDKRAILDKAIAAWKQKMRLH